LKLGGARFAALGNLCLALTAVFASVVDRRRESQHSEVT
jgi:hypothetical protein